MIDVLLDAEKETLNFNAEGDALNVPVTSFMVNIVAGVTSSRVVILAALMHLFCTVPQLGSASQKRSVELRDMALEASSQDRQLQLKVRFTVVFAFVTVIVRGSVTLAYSVGQTDGCVRSLSFALLAALCGMSEVQVIEAMSAGQTPSYPAPNANCATQHT
jgi:hypothetical protein